MKKALKSVALISTLCAGLIHASWEFRTPLSAQWRGYFHWQLSSVADAWWYNGMPTQKDNEAWDFHFWGVGYGRTASQAFWDCDNHNTRQTAGLSALWFGKDLFRSEEAFTNGTFASATIADQALASNTNPYLTFARISPEFHYSEQGAFMGVEFSRNFGSEGKWHAGGRVSIPYKVIEVEQESDYTLEEKLSDVVISRPIGSAPGGNNQTEYAYRFDFLNSLVINQVTTPTQTVSATPFTDYVAGNGTLTIGGRNVMGATAAIVNSAYATVSADGTVPAVPFRKTADQVSSALPATGVGVTDDSTAFFQTGTAYGANLAKDREAQGMLFVVPKAQLVAGTTSSTLTPDAVNVYDQVTAFLNSELYVSQLASTFFLNNGIDLGSYSRNVGIGDLTAEVYGGYGDKQCWFVDGILGLSLPTGKRQKSSNDVYWKATGNNGHVELKLGVDAGWASHCGWFAFEFDAAYHHAFKRSEKRAAAFAGATIVNLGPELEANVSWNYFVMRTDFNFFHPHNSDLGFTLGYELFVKGKDKVSFECDATTATDLLGRANQPLAPCNYEQRTNALSNKLRGQIFNRWNYFEVFAGGSQVVAGRDVMRESEGHIGFVVYF